MNLRHLTSARLSEKAYLAGMGASWCALVFLAVPILNYAAPVASAVIAFFVTKRRLRTLVLPGWVAWVPAFAYLVIGLTWNMVGKVNGHFEDLPGVAGVAAGAIGFWSTAWLFERGREVLRAESEGSA